MPIPGIPPGVNKNCTPVFQLTAQEIIDALDNATTDELLEIEAVLGIPPDLGENLASLNAQMTALQGRVTAVENQIAAINLQLNTINGNVVEINNNITEIQTPGVIINNDYIVEVLGQLNETSWSTIWQRVMVIWRPQFTVSVVFHCGPGINNIDVVFTAPNQFQIQGNIYLGDACGGDMNGLMTLQVPKCSTDEGPIWESIVVPSLEASGSDQTLLFQSIFDAIANLYKCCKPCTISTWALECQTDQNLHDIPTFPFTALKLVLLDEEFVIDTTYGERQGTQVNCNDSATNDCIPWIRLGQMKWLFKDGTCSEFILWRFSGQRFEVPTGDVIGFEVIVQHGITYQAWIKALTVGSGPPSW